MLTTINLIAFETCLPKSIPGPSDLLSIPYFIISKAYPSTKNATRTKTITPTIPNPAKAAPPTPFVAKANAKSTIVAPPIRATIIPKTTYKSNALILLNG